MIWTYFSNDRNGPILILEQRGIDSNEYEEILYERLISMIEDILEVSQDFDIIMIVDENIYLFMHDNIPCHKIVFITKLFRENNVPIMI